MLDHARQIPRIRTWRHPVGYRLFGVDLEIRAAGDADNAVAKLIDSFPELLANVEVDDRHVVVRKYDDLVAAGMVFENGIVPCRKPVVVILEKAISLDAKPAERPIKTGFCFPAPCAGDKE